MSAPASGSRARLPALAPDPREPDVPALAPRPSVVVDPVLAPAAAPLDPTLGSPWTGEAAGPTRAPRRAADTLTALLLVATVVAVLSSAMPVVLRALLPSPPPAAQRGLARTLRGRGMAVGPPRQAHASPAMDLFGPMAQFDPPSFEPDPNGGAEEAPARLVVAKQDVVLRLRADAAGPKVGTVPAGAVMIVAKQAGPWVLVVSGEEENMLMGWAQREMLALP